MNVIEVTNLTKRYGDRTAVDDISFSVEEGEVFGILGPNGAGKTTTVESIAGRELEVLTLIAQGETNRGAAARLFISEATVKTHLLHIYEKLGVNDRAATVAVAYERGLLVPGGG
jgi:ATP/maltotriose-dependent transcriptional regulator MalT